jgi:hypothetical protein
MIKRCHDTRNKKIQLDFKPKQNNDGPPKETSPRGLHLSGWKREPTWYLQVYNLRQLSKPFAAYHDS